MGQKNSSNIILIGFSTSGKSVVAHKVARSLNMTAVDIDDEIVRRCRMLISEIFADKGEPYFRKLEARLLREACRQSGLVIATGGGAVISEENRRVMKKGGFIVCLEAKPETIFRRVAKEDKKASRPLRPLLVADNPLERIKMLKEIRQPFYTVADWTVHTDMLSVDEVCQEIVRGWHYWRKSQASESKDGLIEPAGCVTTLTEKYPVYVGWDLFPGIDKYLSAVNASKTVVIISDDNVFPVYGKSISEVLKKAGYTVHPVTVPAGETSKSLEIAGTIYNRLSEKKVERNDIIMALGGGVVGDLGGFVAATYLRGLPFIQAPTSLIAMVDASIGGKVAVNLPEGKNLVGSFYQPRMVIADVSTLRTLPERELRSGWAEVIKHGLIQDAALFKLLEINAEKLMALEPEITADIIRRSVRVKAKVVSEDEKETGLRMILNYGHTIGHALETATGYQQLLHGEAVAVGMIGAGEMGCRMGFLPAAVMRRQNKLIRKFGLPDSVPGVKASAVLQALALDKKVRGKANRWVLLSGIGRTLIRDDVPVDLVKSVVEGLVK